MIGEAVRLYKEPILKGRETLSSKTVIETANDANETQTQIVEPGKSGTNEKPTPPCQRRNAYPKTTMHKSREQL